LLATQGVHRPNRNGTYISIYLASTNTIVWQADAGYSSDVLYTGNTVAFQVQNASWIPGATYYILFGSGTASGTAFCGPESAPITGIYLSSY
jgi:archaellum component FlaF (FlaF/FlaG flagellin family)